MPARILAIETTTPPVAYSQRELFDTVFSHWYADIPDAESLFMNTTVEQRYTSWDPKELARRVPSTAERVEMWAESTMDMGRRLMTRLFEQVDKSRIGSFVMATCTGYIGPSPELRLAGEFGLPAGLRRTFIGHMGCYAAFNVIKTALDSVSARPDELVLANATEVCSVHMRPEATREQVVTHALFGDAGASLVLGSVDEPGDGPVILRTRTETVYETTEMMTWTITDTGFRMTLSPYVPFILGEKIGPLIGQLCAEEGIAVSDLKWWGIHPGGPKIVDFIGKEMGLSDAQLRASRHVLATYGNCSSATILLVLKEILENDRPAKGEYGVLTGFGPGLTMESTLIRF